MPSCFAFLRNLTPYTDTGGRAAAASDVDISVKKLQAKSSMALADVSKTPHSKTQPFTPLSSRLQAAVRADKEHPVKEKKATGQALYYASEAKDHRPRLTTV
jgi:hypothetical protein